MLDAESWICLRSWFISSIVAYPSCRMPCCWWSCASLYPPLGAWNGEPASLFTLQIDNSAQCVKTWILSAFNWASPWSTTTLQLSVQPFFIVALEKAGAGWLSGAAEYCEKLGWTGSNGWAGSSGWCWTRGVVPCPLVMLLVYVLSVEVIQGSN